MIAAVEATGADAYVADRHFRKREPAFAGAGRYKQLESRENDEPKKFTVEDFTYDERNARCVCPAGQKLYRSGKDMLFNGYRVSKFKAPLGACRECPLRQQCLRHPDRTRQRQVTFIKHREGPPPKRRETREGPAQRMRQKFDTPLGREIYSRRMGTVEPVFANIQNKGMRRLTLRGQRKVSAQWKLFAMVHNIEKVARVAKGAIAKEGPDGPVASSKSLR